MVEVMAKRRKFVARYECDENSYWTVTADCGADGTAISDGQTLMKARKRVRQAIALLLDGPEDSFDVEDKVVLPAPAERALESYRSAQAEAEAKARELDDARRKVAAALVKHGLSLSDTGEILGVSKQRVQQVLDR
jgi:DNA-directed RNA polymerase specialized sigma subunit